MKGIEVRTASQESHGELTRQYVYNDLPAGLTVAYPILQSYQENSGTASTRTYVSAYIQNGTPKTGDWPSITGQNITSVTFSIYTNNTATGALFEIQTW